MANLVDNAIKYSTADAGGEAGAPATRVASASDRVGDTVEISRRRSRARASRRRTAQRALQRFVRLEKSRSQPGSGLGLSLVAAVARLHGGSIRLEDNAPGLKAVLVLPAARRAASPSRCGCRGP